MMLKKLFLKKNSAKLNLSQSAYIRNLIISYEIKEPLLPKKEVKPKN